VFLPLSKKLQLHLLDSGDRGGVGLRCERAASDAQHPKTSGYNSLGPHTRKIDAPVWGKGRLGDFFWFLGSICSARFFRSLEDLKSLRRLLTTTCCKCNKNRSAPPHTWDYSTLFVGADHSICGRKSPGLGYVITPPVGGGRYRRLAPCKGHGLMDKNRWSVCGLPVGHPFCGMARGAQPSPGGTRHPICGSEKAIGGMRSLSVEHPFCGRQLALQALVRGLDHPVCGKLGGQHPVCGGKKADGGGRHLDVNHPVCGRCPALQALVRGLDHPVCGKLGGQHPVCGGKKADGGGRHLDVNHPVCGRCPALQALRRGLDHPVCGKLGGQHPICGSKKADGYSFSREAALLSAASRRVFAPEKK
jgi:hypothetical protein